ncbi:MAG TPA: DUF2459 domain-containing protein [Alphaproteobacteria bacterium]|nr:DUF2459 domain-containing protein [Alphaproteobacteria bacterium]
MYAAWLAACATAPPSGSTPTGSANRVHLIYVINHGWHTGIAIARNGLPAGQVPEAADFPGARFLEFGWGDRDFYIASRPTFLMALDAALTPSAAVMHIVGFVETPQKLYREREVLAVALSSMELELMIAQIDAEFDRSTGGQPVAIAGDSVSRFYPAHGQFHLFNTCNTWVARMLAAAGLPLSPSGVVTADDLMDRLSQSVAER